MKTTEENKVPDILSTNTDNGFETETEACEYVRAKKEWWGSNLVGWVEERNGRWYPCFNVWD